MILDVLDGVLTTIAYHILPPYLMMHIPSIISSFNSYNQPTSAPRAGTRNRETQLSEILIHLDLYEILKRIQLIGFGCDTTSISHHHVV